MSTQVQLDKTLDLGTDIASFFLFHPDDLAHRKNDPLDWHDYGFACGKEFEAGNLVAFRTGGDGGYRLRLTSGELTDVEKNYSTGSWEWGYTVRHGKFLVDNGDYLPSEEAFDIDDISKEQWVTIPDGNYRVTVSPIDRGKDDTLPDYVIQFEAVDAPLHIVRSPSPPDLLPLRDSPPQAVEGGSANISSEKSDDEPLAEFYPFLVEKAKYTLPGDSASVPVPDDIFESLGNALMNSEDDVYVALAPEGTVPGLATLARLNGSSQAAGELGHLNMVGERFVRVTHKTDGTPLPSVKAESVTREKSLLSEAQIDSLKEAFETYADKHTGKKSGIRQFDRDRIAATTDSSSLTSQLMRLLPLSGEARFRLQGASDIERAEELLTHMS